MQRRAAGRGSGILCLLCFIPARAQVAFFLPQLVQMLRGDDGGAVEAFLREEARRSRLFAHLLLCALRTEGTPPPEAFAPAVKRSGWAKPEDSGIWGAADRVADKARLHALDSGF